MGSKTIIKQFISPDIIELKTNKIQQYVNKAVIDFFGK
jgi:hypothetical protein